MALTCDHEKQSKCVVTKSLKKVGFNEKHIKRAIKVYEVHNL